MFTMSPARGFTTCLLWLVFVPMVGWSGEAPRNSPRVHHEDTAEVYLQMVDELLDDCQHLNAEASQRYEQCKILGDLACMKAAEQNQLATAAKASRLARDALSVRRGFGMNP